MFTRVPVVSANVFNQTNSDYTVIYTAPAASYAKIYLRTTAPTFKEISFNGAIGIQLVIASSGGIYGPFFVGPGAAVEVLGSGGGGTVYIFGVEFTNAV